MVTDHFEKSAPVAGRIVFLMSCPLPNYSPNWLSSQLHPFPDTENGGLTPVLNYWIPPTICCSWLKETN